MVFLLFKGPLNLEGKAISLFQCWTTKVVGAATKLKTGFLDGDSIPIQSDLFVLLNVKTGTGSDTSTVSKPFRVITIYEKYYNKWLIAKDPMKR